MFSYSEILVRKKDYFAAVECLEKVLKTIPNSPDTLSLLGFILAKDANKRPKALNYLQRAIERNPRDPTIHLMYATVLKGNVVDFARSLEAYGKSMGLDGSGVNPTTYNNVGVLNAWKSDFDEAEEKYNAAIKHLTGIKLEGPEALGPITKILESGKDHAIVFNLARLYEEKKEYEKAANIQKTIIKSLPAYTGSYVRPATIARDMGSIKQCAEWLKQALEVSTEVSTYNTELLYERLLDEGQSFKPEEASQDPAEGSKMDEGYEKAMEYLRQSENITPDSEDIAFNAKVHLEEAKATFEELKKAEKSKTANFKHEKYEKFAEECAFGLSQIGDQIKYEADKEVYDQNKREEQRKKALDSERERKIQELTREA
ncbi:hypothetical protein TrRE_jg2878 [Triparma retinervis]|uniref:Tetratricopeptide repeat protein n=1 Tax=Triparma retinervis TaxID=2557542 RepID=A0A9W7L7G4_9STRA|nr:hypothetical protein TrRE_jg2878 [Triparma retinervis]